MGGMMNMMSMIPNMVNGIRENQARAALMRTVKFVVGETATPSPEMVSFAVVAGASPTTQGERDAYLDMMKKIARQTPEVAQNFLKTENVNGTQTLKLDDIKLDAHITKRAMMYGQANKAKRDRKAKEEQMLRHHEMELMRMNQMHELNMMAMMGTGMNPGAGGMGNGVAGAGAGGQAQQPHADAFVMDSTTYFGDPNRFALRSHDNTAPTSAGGQQGLSPASDGTISLTDIYRMLNNGMQAHGQNGPVGPIVPPAATTDAPANNNLDLGAMMLGSMAM